MQEFVYRDVLSLSCPVGEFIVCHRGERIPFSIRKNKYDIPYDTITTETNYALDIDTGLLTVGKQYEVIFTDGDLHFCGSDEHTESITGTIGKWSVGIGVHNINDNYFCQSEHKKGYDVWRSENNRGYSFVLLDRTVDTITFLIAWIENKELSNVNYENVLDFWLT
ncbi:MAG: hypothetical protein J6D20_00755 [Clostridia bacterium]|nr:hypothetical protein [Clostridia bacterium]